MDRAITPHEASIVEWLLDNAPLGDVAPYRQRPVQELRVVEECDYGCCIVFLQPNKGDVRVLADALAVYAEGLQSNLILWGRGGEIAYLEVCDFDPRSPHRVPEIANLRTWEQRGLELL